MYKSVILAGGKGTRLQPFTFRFPKPLVPIGDMPVLEILLRRLIRTGLTNVTLTLGHLAELIKAFVNEHQYLSQQLSISYIREQQPTGTAGSLSFISDLTDTFIVMNGDLLTNLDYQKLIKYHQQQGGILTIATQERREKVDLGVIKLNGDGKLIDYLEKPESSYTVSMGIYVYERSVMNYIEYGKYLDFPTLVHRLLEAGEPVVAYPSHDLWLDIGRVDDYARAQQLFVESREEFGIDI